MALITLPYHFITFEKNGQIRPSEGQAFAILDNNNGNVIYQYYVATVFSMNSVKCYPIITCDKKERKCTIDTSIASQTIDLNTMDDTKFIDWGYFI